MAHRGLLRRLLRGARCCRFDAGRADVVDILVVLTAARTGSTVVTSDPTAIAALAREMPTPIGIRAV